jgi:hypothetical protein
MGSHVVGALFMMYGGSDVFLEVNYINGTAAGVVHAHKPGGVAAALKCSRSDYSLIRNREELEKVCVYLLVDARESINAEQRIVVEPHLYIGMAETAHDRLYNHVINKEFWSSLIVFTSSDRRFNSAHAKYIESELLRIGRERGRSNIQNTANSRLSSLSPGDIQYARTMLSEILLLAPVFGVNAFEPASAARSTKLARTNTPAPNPVNPTPPSIEQTTNEPFLVRLHALGGIVDAQALFTPPRSMTVLKGSKGPASFKPSADQSIHKRRAQLLDQGILAVEGGSVVFTRDHTFDSPSGAAVVITGGNEDGWRVWKDEHQRALGLRMDRYRNR